MPPEDLWKHEEQDLQSTLEFDRLYMAVEDPDLVSDLSIHADGASGCHCYNEEKPGINPFFCPCRLVSYKSGDILNDFSLIQHSHHLPAELQLDEDKITRRMPDKILETGAVTSQSPSNTCFPSWANRDPILQRIVATQIRPTPKKPTDHVPQWPTRSTVGQVGSLLSKEPKPVSRMLQTKPPGTKLSLKKISQFRPFSIKKRGLKSMKFARVHPMKTRSQSVQLFWELNAGGATISKLKW